MNKRGFMFIETIITLTVLLTALLYLYTSFSNLIIKEQEATNYDNVIYQYRLDYVKKYIDLSTAISSLESGNLYFDLKNAVSNEIKDTYELEGLIIVKKDADLKNITSGFNNDFKNYLHSSFTEPSYNYEYQIIGEFHDSTLKQYQYAWIGYPVTK